MIDKAFTRFAKKPESGIDNIDRAYRENGESDLNETDGKKKALMDYAAEAGNLQLAIWLALNGVNINSQNSGGKTPLHRAVEKKQRPITIFLLMLDADITLQSSTSSNKSAFEPRGYTNNQEHKENIALFRAVCNEIINLRKQASPDLSEHPILQQHAPDIVGHLTEVSGITNHDLMAFYNRYPTLGLIQEAIENNEEARTALNNVFIPERTEIKNISSRRSSSYEKNLTPSLLLTDAQKRALKTLQTLPHTEAISAKLKAGLQRAQILLLSNPITYHQELRLQLAFYLFVAYYKTRIQVELTDTTQQQGQGNSTIGTQACHSALISDTSELFRWKHEVAVTPSTRPSRSAANKLEHVHLTNNNAFKTALSTTIELLSAVNQYDKQLEGRTTLSGAAEGRRILRDLLQRTSLGEINPLEALDQFLLALIKTKGILDNIRTSGYLKEHRDTSPQPMRPAIHRIVFLTTLLKMKKREDGTLHLKPQYAQHLLFMSAEDRHNAKHCTSDELNALHERYFSQLQAEIISPTASHGV